LNTLDSTYSVVVSIVVEINIGISIKWRIVSSKVLPGSVEIVAHQVNLIVNPSKKNEAFNYNLTFSFKFRANEYSADYNVYDDELADLE
jgi:hypothetical protein